MLFTSSAVAMQLGSSFSLKEVRALIYIDVCKNIHFLAVNQNCIVFYIIFYSSIKI